MQETALITYFLIGILYPIIYVLIKKVREKFLFISATYGAAILIQLLIMISIAPLYILDLWFFPKLEFLGYTSNIYFILGFGEKVFSDSFLWLLLPLHILVTTGLSRKYEVFNKNA